MIDGRRVLAVIPARGGSKGIPRKNLALLGGRPLIAWTIEAARASTLVDRAILSSDDPEIIAAAVAAGCEAPFVRPAELASDTARSIDVVRHAMDFIEKDEGRAYDYLALLQPTSPFRTATDIDACVRLCHRTGAPSALGVTAPSKSPFWMYAKDADERLTPLLPRPSGVSRRQDLPEAFALNGAVYVARWEALRREDSFVMDGVRGYEMPEERSLDIDTPLDLRIAQVLAQEPLA